MIGGLTLIRNDNLLVSRAHPMASERTLAKVAGGRWWSKTELVPDPSVYRVGHTVYGHAATLEQLVKRIFDGLSAQ